MCDLSMGWYVKYVNVNWLWYSFTVHNIPCKAKGFLYDFPKFAIILCFSMALKISFAFGFPHFLTEAKHFVHNVNSM